MQRRTWTQRTLEAASTPAHASTGTRSGRAAASPVAVPIQALWPPGQGEPEAEMVDTKHTQHENRTRRQAR
jgi:hypothetical protein